MPQQINASFQIVTPMFIGDANQETNSLRPPSIKGALRFWWRALHWSRHYADAGQIGKAALGKLHQEEAQIFGAAATRENGESVGGQSAYLLRLDSSQASQRITQDDLGRDKALAANQGFTVRLLERPNAGLTPEQRQGVRDALQAWGTFGGLGARARRGYGAVAITSLDGEARVNATPQDYELGAQSLIDNYGLSEREPPYSALSRASRFVALTPQKSSIAALNGLGKSYKEARDPKAQNSIKGRERIALGLPLKGFEDSKRRASPIFMHIHPVGDRYVAAALYLPAQFHPQMPKVSLAPAAQFMDMLNRQSGSSA